MLVLGANFYATVVGNMSLLVANLNATAARHNQRAETIQEAMRYLNVSSQMQSRVQVCQTTFRAAERSLLAVHASWMPARSGRRGTGLLAERAPATRRRSTTTTCPRTRTLVRT